ncbi:MAG: hypothetical protein JWO36_6170 [Myxococcales bacterium]|nr:hypothetical protein [Myxococcales bacterium]
MGCPDDNVLVAMVEQTLDPQVFGELELHIDSCAHCRQLVGALAGTLAGRKSLAAGSSPSTTEDRPLALHSSVNDRYLIDSELGRGGMGTVYLARDLTLDRDVALKVHRPGSGNDRLHREAIAMAKLAHPNVVTVFEIATLEDRLYVAMEYVRGETLRTWVTSQPRGWREVIAVLVEVGRGLAAAHAAGLVHRDFKPENVLVGEDGRPRVSDFGLARSARTASGVRISKDELDKPLAIGSAPTQVSTPLDAVMTQTGAVLGTPAYMAPEQFAGDAVDARCDQFAFCVVVWECLFGRRPFVGGTLAAIQLAIEQRDLHAPSDRRIPERVRQVLEKGLAADPRNRFSDMPALLAALRKAAAPRTARRIAIASVACVALGGIALAAGFTWTSQRHEAACANAGDRIRAVFGEDTRTAIRLQLLSTGSPMASSAFEHTAGVLDRYVKTLADQASAVCRGRDEPARMTAARRACLAGRNSELAGVIEVLRHPDTELVQRAPNAAWAIYDPKPCDDAHALLATPVGAVASSPEQVAALGRIKAFAQTGRFQEAVVSATSLLAEARAHGDHALELEVLMQLGAVKLDLEDADAPAIFHQAEALAEAQGRDLEAGVALTNIASFAGLTQHDYVAAHRFIELAHAKLERLGGSNLAETGDVLSTEAQILFDENRLADGETTIKRAIVVLEQVYGPDHPKVGRAVGIYSEILRSENKDVEAVVQSRRTLQILEPSLGADHPMVAGAEMNLASSLIDIKQYDEARKRLQRADSVFARIYGADHPTRVAIFGNLGSLEQAQSHWEAALVAYRSALAIVERNGGAMSPSASGIHRDLARTLLFAGRYEQAAPEEQRSIEILEKLGPDGQSRLQGALVDLAQIQLERRRAALALPIAERALAIATNLPDSVTADELAEARFTLARSQWDAGGDRVAARSLAQQALAGQVQPDKREAITRWLAQPAVVHASR